MSEVNTTAIINAIAISTTKQEPKPGFLAVTCTARETKGKTIPPEQRCRSIILPESHLLVPVGQCAPKFLDILNAELHSLARKRLEAAWEDGDQREISSDAFTIDALLAFFAAKTAATGIDGDAIAAWLKQSATFAALPDDAIKASWLLRLPKLAAPAYRQALGSQPAQAAATIIQRIAADDADHPVCKFIISRCNVVIGEGAAAF